MPSRRANDPDTPIPSTHTRDYWLWAERRVGTYPKHTEHGGKWLIFVPVTQVDAVWASIKQATEDGRLGETSKAATAKPNRYARDKNMRVICIYTYDGDDADDRRGIRQELRAMGFTEPLSWKADSATRAGIYSGGTDGRASRYRE